MFKVMAAPKKIVFSAKGQEPLARGQIAILAVFEQVLSAEFFTLGFFLEISCLLYFFQESRGFFLENMRIFLKDLRL